MTEYSYDKKDYFGRERQKETQNNDINTYDCEKSH